MWFSFTKKIKMNYKKHLFLSFFILVINLITAQENDFKVNDLIVDQLPKNVSIVGLGDPTHQESTITKYRIDLIKKLIEEKQFKIIAIEGNMYGLYKGFQRFMEDKKISHIEKAMYRQLNLPEMDELYQYVYDRNQKGDSVMIVGFDCTFQNEIFVEYIKEDLKNIDVLTEEEKQDFFITLTKASDTSLKVLFKNREKIKSKIVHYSKKILSDFSPKTESDYFLQQTLESFVFRITNENNGKNPISHRDMGMARNIAFLKERYNTNIILFASSTHLLKESKGVNDEFRQNNRICGDILNDKYKDAYYYIAYSGISGQKLNPLNPFNNFKVLPELSPNSVEHEYQNIDEPIFLNKSNFKKDTTYSRFMGYQFVELNIWKVMDGLVLIDNVSPSKWKKKLDEPKNLAIAKD